MCKECPKCGATIAGNATFHAKCGWDVRMTKEEYRNRLRYLRDEYLKSNNLPNDFDFSTIE